MDDGRGDEQADEAELEEGAHRRDPLGPRQGQDGGQHGDPDEADLERVVGARALLEVDEVGAGGLGVEEGHRAPDPHGLGDPCEGGGDGGDRTAEGPARPQVDAALAGEGRAGLGEDEGVGHEEDRDEEDEPGEGLGALGRDRAEHLEADDGREDEEDDVEASQGALEAPGLPLRHARVGGVIVLGHCCPSRSRTPLGRRPAVLRPAPRRGHAAS